MTYQNLNFWFDSWEVFVVEYGFTTINSNSELHFDEKLKKRILNMDKTCLSLDGNNCNHDGLPTVTYCNVCLPQLGIVMSKLALMTMNNDDKWEYCGWRAASTPLPVSDLCADS